MLYDAPTSRTERGAMRFIPRDEKFYDLFEELASKIEEGGKLFIDILNNYKHSQPQIAKLKEIEHEADSITHNTYERMHRTLLTPLDREDIRALLNKMDSVLDMIEDSAAGMYFFGVKEPREELHALAKILVQAITKIKDIVYALRDKKKSKMILAACVDINTLENEGDYIMRSSVARLFEGEKDAIELIKWKEILERIEDAIDLCEDVSNIVEGIILKRG
jgi:predicted phosphate transport protein (TIGR00153 family)